MSRPKSKEMDLTVGNPFWSLLKFAIPVILGNLFQLFYTLADSVIVGKTLGADSLAAVGATSIIIYFVFCFINGFTGGSGTALANGVVQRTKKACAKVFLLDSPHCQYYFYHSPDSLIRSCWLTRFSGGCRFRRIFPAVTINMFVVLLERAQLFFII